MSLTERLKRAQTERLLAAGLVHSEAALKPEAADVDDGASGDRLFEPVTVEVRSAGLHPVADTGAIVNLEDADPVEQSTACPNCRRPGVVDMVDLVGHRTHYSCPTCGTLWQARREPADDAVR